MNLLIGNSIAPTLRSYFTNCAENGSPLTLLPASLGKFLSSEAFSEIKPNHDINGQPVIVMQSLASVGDHTANDFAMELLLTIQTLKRNGAGPIWAIIPFFAYSRQDRPFNGKMTSVGVDDYAALLKFAGAIGITTIEMHSQAGLQYLSQHFGEGNVCHLTPTELFTDYLKEKLSGRSIAVGGPDAGASVRADAVRSSLDADGFAYTKEHIDVNGTKIASFNGDVHDKVSITIDDMIDSGGTIRNAQIDLEKRGTTKRIIAAAHGIFSNKGLESLFTAKACDNTPLIAEILVTDSIDTGEKLTALRRQYTDGSVDRRIKVLSLGPQLMRHISCDIFSHPDMKTS